MTTKFLAVASGGTRKPTKLKELSGTNRKDRANPREPKLQPVPIGEPPEDLTEFEMAAWVELRVVVDPMTIATAADLTAFRQMVEDVGMLASLRKSFIDAGGLPVYSEMTKTGEQLRMRPEVYSIPTYRKLVLLHFARWGLTPADRARVSTLSDDLPKTNPIAKFGLGANRAG